MTSTKLPTVTTEILDRFEINSLITTFREADVFWAAMYRNVFKKVGIFDTYTSLLVVQIKGLDRVILGPSISQEVFWTSLSCSHLHRFVSSTQSLTLWFGCHGQQEHYGQQGLCEQDCFRRDDSNFKKAVRRKNENKYHNTSVAGLLLPKKAWVKERKLRANN